MILCTAQINPCWNDPQSTFKRIETLVAEAVECDASFVAFSEQVTTGWDPHDAENHVEDDNGEILSRFRDTARDYSIGILGSYKKAHHPKPYNTAVAISPEGSVLAEYNKIHLFSPAGEDQEFDAGTEPAIFTYEGCRCGIAICYDLRFSSIFRMYRDAGVHLVLVPSAWPASRIHHFELFTTTRAVEFQMYIAGINTIGTTPVDQYSGRSRIVSPDGTVLNQADDREELLFCEVVPECVEEARRTFPVERDEKRF